MLLTQTDKKQILSNSSFFITNFHISPTEILSEPQNQKWLLKHFNTVKSEFQIKNATKLKCTNIKTLHIDDNYTPQINNQILPITNNQYNP